MGRKKWVGRRGIERYARSHQKKDDEGGNREEERRVEQLRKEKKWKNV